MLLLAAVDSCDPAVFKHPLAEPEKAKADPKLPGTWGGRDESTEFVLFVQPVPPGRVDVTLVGRGTTDGVAHMSWRGVPATVGGKTYLSLQEKHFTDNVGGQFELKPGFIVVRYELKGDALKLSYLSSEGLALVPGGPAATSAEPAAVASALEKLPPKAFPHFLDFKRFKVP